ncbi:peptidoglycan-binding protein [Streptomyces sp. AB3(2024)]|uniref:peptidoglycan-binding domain-containing protein n=1 Tax=Streptomyces sp. AB3(2024) TaxID=3317321 RepID=UPI0035A3183C
MSDLQERLYGQGFTYVSQTGVYDEQTRRGVAQLQRDRDIKGDPRGIYGPATRAAFG